MMKHDSVIGIEIQWFQWPFNFEVVRFKFHECEKDYYFSIGIFGIHLVIQINKKNGKARS